MPSPEEIRRVIETYVERMCASDVDGILDLYAEDATAEDPVGGTIQRGREALGSFYAGTAPHLQVEITGPIRVSGRECAVPLLAELTMNDNKLYVDVIDVPGTYSLVARTSDEQIAVESLIGLRGERRPDAAIIMNIKLDPGELPAGKGI